MSQPFDRQQILGDITRRAAHLLILLETYRRSGDPRLREAYDDAHDLISDLAGLAAVVLLEHQATEDDPGPPLPAAC